MNLTQLHASHASSQSAFKKPLFIVSHLALLTALMLWFLPLTHPFCKHLDAYIFFLLNGSLTEHWLWLRFWGLLNHRREVMLNLVFAALVNIWAILQTRNPQLRKIRTQQILYFWFFFEIGFILQDGFFHHVLQITRYSPSLILQPFIKLSALLNDPNIKDTSFHSFPSGHGFALVYWAAFTYLCAPRKIGLFGILMSLLLCFARLFGGAHWFSDVLFSALLALVWLSWTLCVPAYRRIIGERGIHHSVSRF